MSPPTVRVAIIGCGRFGMVLRQTRDVMGYRRQRCCTRSLSFCKHQQNTDNLVMHFTLVRVWTTFAWYGRGFPLQPPSSRHVGKIFHRLAEQLFLRQARTYRQIISR